MTYRDRFQSSPASGASCRPVGPDHQLLPTYTLRRTSSVALSVALAKAYAECAVLPMCGCRQPPRLQTRTVGLFKRQGTA
jgi:hypothetical protein